MNLKNLLVAVVVAVGATATPVFAQSSGNFGCSGSGGSCTNVDNISFSIVGNQVLISTNVGAPSSIEILPGQDAGDAIQALLAELEASGGVFGGLQAQAIREAAKRQGLIS